MYDFNSFSFNEFFETLFMFSCICLTFTTQCMCLKIRKAHLHSKPYLNLKLRLRMFKKKEIQHNTWYLVWLSGTIACEFWIVITFYIWESDFALLPRQICLPLGFLKRMFLVNICKSLFTVTLLNFGQKSLIRFIITKWAFFLNTYVACYAVMYLKKNP